MTTNRKGSLERGSYTMLVSGDDGEEMATAAGLRNSHRIKSVNNLIGVNYNSGGSRSRERKVSSSSATTKVGGGAGGRRIVDECTSMEKVNQPVAQRKLVRIIDHHLDW